MSQALNSKRNRLIVTMREAGDGPREIARKVGVSPGVVAGVLYRAGIVHEPSKDQNGYSREFRAHILAGGKGAEIVPGRTLLNWHRRQRQMGTV